MARDSTSPTLRGLPTVDEMLDRPELGVGLPRDVALPLQLKVVALGAALSIATGPSAPATRPTPDGDRFLDAREVAERIGLSRSWVLHNTAELPKRRRVGGKGLWSEREIEAWIRRRPLWDED